MQASKQKSKEGLVGRAKPGDKLAEEDKERKHQHEVSVRTSNLTRTRKKDI